jgi:hypothetical protein
MLSTVVVRCLACNAKVKAPAQIVGQVRPCPRCQKPLLIRNSPPRDAGPVLVSDEEQAVHS